MTNASLARKLARLADRVGAQRRGMLIEDRDPRTPHDLLAEEQDRRREALAEELLKIFAEEADPFQFVDTRRTEPRKSKDGDPYETEHASLTVVEWGVKLAHAALAAAMVLYPEVPAEPLIGEGLLGELDERGEPPVPSPAEPFGGES